MRSSDGQEAKVESRSGTYAREKTFTTTIWLFYGILVESYHVIFVTALAAAVLTSLWIKASPSRRAIRASVRNSA